MKEIISLLKEVDMKNLLEKFYSISFRREKTTVQGHLLNNIDIVEPDFTYRRTENDDIILEKDESVNGVMISIVLTSDSDAIENYIKLHDGRITIPNHTEIKNDFDEIMLQIRESEMQHEEERGGWLG